MSRRADPARDPYAFSLRGMAAMNSHAFVPAIADDVLNKTWDHKLRHSPDGRRGMARHIEDFLVRFFRTGCRGPA